MPNPADTHDYGRFDELAEEFAERYRRGERPSLQEYVDRLPEMADEIRELFPALVEVEQADDDARGETVPKPAPHLTQIGDYRILREVGRGGMGVVYEAEQISLGRRVALKLLLGQVLGDRKALERFRREAKSAARLHHTNIVPVFEVGQEKDVCFYAMQLIQGQGLDQVIDELRRVREPVRKPIAPARPDTSDAPATVFQERLAASRTLRKRDLGRIAESLLSGRLVTEGVGLSPADSPAAPGFVVTEPFDPDATSAHSVAVSNGMRSRLAPVADTSGSAMLPGGKHVSEVDTSGRRQPYFRSVAQIGRQAAQGMAHAHSRGVIHRDIKPSNLLLDIAGVVWITDFGLAKADDDGMTATGDILGTLRYMAPERFRGEGDARVDLYALGLTLYELLTLRPAYESSDRLKLVEQIKSEEPIRPRLLDSRIPRDLETIVLKAIDKDPERRYATSEAMSEDLRRFLADEPIKARQVGTPERYWRWARRNPVIASLGAMLSAVLVLVTILSLLAAGQFAQLAETQGNSAASERSARLEADGARKAAETARAEAQAEAERAMLSERKAVSERKRADTMLADMFTSRGLLAGERDSPAEAVLWFASAADQSATAENSRRLDDNRLRSSNWMRQAIVPVAAITLPMKVTQVDFQPRGDLLLVLYGKSQVTFWSRRDGRQLPWAENLVGVASARFSPDGGSVALGFLTGEVQLRHVADGELLAKIRHPGEIAALAFSPDGRFLAIASKVARVWDISAKAFLDPVWRHPAQVSALFFNRKGDRLITACHDRKARLFDPRGGKDRNAPLFAPVANATLSRPALIDDDRVLVTMTGGSELTRWNMATGQAVSSPISARPNNLQGVVASPDGRWFTTGGYYGPELFATDGKQPPAHLGHTNQVRAYAFSPDNTMLLSVSIDQTARLWSIPDSRPLVAPLKHMANVETCAWSDDSTYFATSQNDGLIRVWRRPVHDLVIAQEPGWGQRPRLSSDGRLAVPGFWHESALGGKNQTINRLRVIATDDGQPAGKDISLPGVLVDSCVCSDNLAVAAVTSRGSTGQLGVWDVATSRARFEPIALPGEPIAIAARPGSGQLAVICFTGDLLVIDDQTGKRLLELRHAPWGNVGKAVQVQYSANGKTLVSLCDASPQTIYVRDADSGRLRFAPFQSSVAGSNFHSFCLSTDSRLMATIGLVKNVVQVWDLATGRALSSPLPHPGDFWGLFSVRFSSDGRHLLTGNKDGQARYWDWQAGQLACPPMSHDNEVHDVAITSDGRFALTVTGGRPELHVWELATGRRVAPPVRLDFNKAGWCDTLAITPDRRRALVCSMRTNLAVVNLDELLSTAKTQTAELELFAELATAQRIDLGDLSGLTTDQWRERWDLLLEKSPDLLSSSATEAKISQAVVRRILGEAQSLIQSGVASFEQSRFEAAVADLQQASQRLQALRQPRPGDPLLARLHGTSLGFLASSLRDLKRPGEALAQAQESLSAYLSILDPDPGDLYNMACDGALVSLLDNQISSDDREKLQARAVGYLRKSIDGDPDSTLPLISSDQDLDPLRHRLDFRELMIDAKFPKNPFRSSAR